MFSFKVLFIVKYFFLGPCIPSCNITKIKTFTNIANNNFSKFNHSFIIVISIFINLLIIVKQNNCAKKNSYAIELKYLIILLDSKISINLFLQLVKI